MSEVPTRSDPERALLRDFTGLRDSLRQERIGHGGHEVCEELTTALDRAVGSLLPDQEGIAVVALGGYGRREMSPFSDVDLMLLHDRDDASEEAAALFRPLWDAGLRVGHSTRDVAEASTAARERFETQTTLLTSRLVSGDVGLYDRLMEGVAAVTRARPLRGHLVAEERARREAQPFLLMSADVKAGRGGLRTLQGVDWEHRREQLIGRFSTDGDDPAAGARESLLRIRNGLHVVSGRAHDVFSPELREPVARWLGVDVTEAAAMLVDALQEIDGLATRRWPEVIEAAPTRRRSVFTWRSPRPAPVPTDPPGSVDGLAALLASGEPGRVAFERFWEQGSLTGVLPEWEVVRSLPQLEPFHEHPVSTHLWRTAAEMKTLMEEGGHRSRVAAEIGSDALLLVVAFLHDIGKGHGGDHARVGAAIAREVCVRLDADPETTRLVAEGVLHHLLLPVTATRRDLDDPAVIEEIARQVGDLRLLQVLYLLTVADSRATGPTMWNEWKDVLVRTLFARCAAVFGGDRPAEAVAETDLETVLTSVPPERRAELEAHVSGMPSEYLRSSSAEEAVWHADLIAGITGACALGVRPGPPFDRAVVVGGVHRGFRRDVAAVFAANGVDVLEARLLTRSDGVAIDTYRVRDDRTMEPVDPGKWDKVRNDLEAGLSGDLDAESRMAERAAAYPDPVHTGEKPSVRAEVDQASGDLVLTVKCSDRIGRLAEILTILNDCGLVIRLAKLESRLGGVVDAFHVEDPGLSADPDALRTLEDRVSSAIVP